MNELKIRKITLIAFRRLGEIDDIEEMGKWLIGIARGIVQDHKPSN